MDIAFERYNIRNLIQVNYIHVKFGLMRLSILISLKFIDIML